MRLLSKLSNEEKGIIKKLILITTVISIAVSTLILIFYRNFLMSILGFFGTYILILLYAYFKKVLKRRARIKKLEEVFPDFLQLMSSNLRAGMTIDRAMMLSSRPEFAPLDDEILQTGKDITTGKSIEMSLLDMSKRINSEKINKTILLIISGIRAGGDLAVLLDETAVYMRERGFVEKKASSSVLMYVIFIFLAVSIFAPALFSLSTVLVEILEEILSGIPTDLPTNVSAPFTLSKLNISITFIKYFSIAFMLTIDLLSSLVLGLVNKGDEKEGLKYFPAILVISVFIFFFARILIANFLGDLL